mgnify:CR=1 FL=1
MAKIVVEVEVKSITDAVLATVELMRELYSLRGAHVIADYKIYAKEKVSRGGNSG